MPEDNKVTLEQFTALQAQAAKAERLIAELTTALANKDEAVKTIEFSLRRRDAEHSVERFVAAGKLPPALKGTAVAILLAPGVVSFSDSNGNAADKPVAELFTSLLEGLPNYLGKGIKGKPVDDGDLEQQVQRFKAMGLSEEGAKEAAKLAVEQFKQKGAN
jgi:hypothetical protein